MTASLERIAAQEIRVVEILRLTPLALPISAEFVQSRLTTKDWLTQITDMSGELETAATT